MKEFGELESAIMDVVWEAEHPLQVRDVRERLDYSRTVAYTTVMTVMDILHRKQVLQRSKNGRAWRYWPTETRTEHTARLMNEVLGTSGDPPATLLHLVHLFSDEDRAWLHDVLHREVCQGSTTAL
ncbi:MAG TPA: BlaI/MecI/CopY family transcriptional regulator [Streptosporangiaceae bacterium]